MFRHLSAAVIGLFLLALPLSAQAQTAAKGGPLWTEAQALIDGTGAPEFFENQSSESEMKVLHTASGLVCIFEPGRAQTSLMVFPSGLERGDDVGCNIDMGPMQITFYATRYGPGYSARDSAQDAANAIGNRWPDAQAYEGPVVSMEMPEGISESALGAFLITDSGRVQYTQVATAKVGEWIFKQRMSGGAGDDAVLMNQILAVSLWEDVLTSALSR